MSLLDKQTNASLKFQKNRLIIDKTQPAPRPLVIKQPIRPIISSSLQNRITSADMTDLLLLKQNQRVGVENRKRNQVPKTMTKIENEIVANFEATQPERFLFIDPVTGGEVYRKFNTEGVQPPNLITEPAGVFEEYADKIIPESMVYEETLRARKIRDEQNAEYYDLIDEIRAREELDKELKDYLNTHVLTKKEKSELKLKIADNEFYLNDARQYSSLVRQDIAQKTEAEITEMEDAVKRHNILVEEKRKANEDAIKAYGEEINLLNKGAFNTQKVSTETEEEYLDRLRRNAEEILPQELLEEANAKILIEFRKKLDEITRDPVKIDQISNSFDENEKYELIKAWKLVKEKYNRVYGLTNKQVSADTIISFFRGLLHGKEEARELPSAIQEILSVNEAGGEVSQIGEVIMNIQDDTVILQKSNVAGQPPVYLKIVRLPYNYHGNQIGAQRRNVLVYSFTGEAGSYKQYFNQTVPYDRRTQGKGGQSYIEIQDKTGITPKDFYTAIKQTPLQELNPYSYAMILYQKYHILPVDIQDAREQTYKITSSGPSDRYEVGLGISKKQEPKLVPFGNVVVNYPNLKYKDILTIKTHLHKTIGGVPNKKVSKKLASIILNLLEKIQPTQDELYRLSSEERQIYDRLIHLGRLHKELPHTNDKSVSDYKKRLKLLEGEIEIGNNSPQIIKEIKHILVCLKELHAITEKQRKEYEKQNLS